MANAKHTPGPWELVSLSGWGSPFSIRMAYTSDRDGVPDTHYGVQSVRRREDAQFISAAPDLLTAGKHLAVKLAEVYRAAGANPAECQAIRDWMKAAAKAEPRHD